MNLDSLGYSLDEQIYYGVITLYLYECTGEYNSFNPNNIIQDELNEKNIKKILQNLKPLSYINSNYDHIYLPCIPETDIKYINDKSNNSSNSPFLNPLIKFDINMLRQSEEFKNLDKYIGIMSGTRSAIIKDKSGKFYRLKGCGNNKRGFTLLNYDNEDIFKKREIRGCQFENNIFRELYYTNKINNILKKYNLVGCNIPIGYFKYDKNIKFINNTLNKDNEIINEVPEIDKYCSIYETLGDRRLGSHLLNGIEMLIESIIETAIDKYDLNEKTINDLINLFNEERRKISIESAFIIENVYMPKDSTIKVWCSKPIYKKESYDILITYNKLIELLRINEDLIKIKNSSNFIGEWGKNFEKKVNFKKNHANSIISELIKLRTDSPDTKTIFEYILDIFVRVGYETAKIKRIFQEEEFNWGTYNGHSPFDIFCSAHYNNFVVLPAKYGCLLSPIDFDLAFEKKNFFDNDKQSDTLGKHNELLFDRFMNREINKLLYNVINPKNNYYLNDDKEKNIKLKIKEIIYFILNDSLIECFMKTFDKIKCPYIQKYDSSTEITEILVKLCLIATYDRNS